MKMKRLVSVFMALAMLLSMTAVNAEDTVIDVGDMISAGAASWGAAAEDVAINGGVLSINASIASYTKEKYADGTAVFAARVGDNAEWSADKKSWFGIGLRQKTTNNAVWVGAEAAYLVVVKPNQIELQKWIGGSDMLQVVETDAVADTGWHNYEFKTKKTDEGMELAFAIDGETIINYLDDSNKRLTISGYTSFYNQTSDLGAGSLEIKAFEGEMTEFSSAAAPSEDTDEPTDADKGNTEDNGQNVPAVPGKGNDGEKAPEYTIYPADDVTIMVLGSKLTTDTAPVIVNDRVLVPFRAIFEAMGAEVEWNEATRTVKATKGVYSVELIIDASTGILNGSFTMLDTPAIIVNDRTMVPVRVCGEGLNANVDWEAETRTVIINNK